MSLLSVPKQRRSSSHVRVDDEGWEKLYEIMINTIAPCSYIDSIVIPEYACMQTGACRR